MGASVRPHSNDNPFAQPGGVALEPQDPTAPQRHYSPDNPFAQPNETYSPDNPFAASTIRHAPVVVTPDALPPAVVSDTAPGPMRMPPAVVEAQPPAQPPAPAPFRAPDIPAAQPDASRVGAPPGSQGTPLAQSDFLTRVAGALFGPVVDPIGTAKGMGRSVEAAVMARAEDEVRHEAAEHGEDLRSVPHLYNPEEAAAGAGLIAALPLSAAGAVAGEALGPALAPLVGSRISGLVSRVLPATVVGAGIMPQDPGVGALLGGGGALVANELGTPARPKVTRAITREPGAMLPAEATPRAPTATIRPLSPDNPFAHEGPDFTVETNPAPPSTPAAPPAPAGLNIEPVAPTPEPAPAAVASPSGPFETIDLGGKDAGALTSEERTAARQRLVEQRDAIRRNAEEAPPAANAGANQQTRESFQRRLDAVERDLQRLRSTAPAPAGVSTETQPQIPTESEAPREAVGKAAPESELPPAPTKIKGDVIFEDGEKRFVDARTRSNARRNVAKVSTDGLVAELDDVMKRRDDAIRRAQYENRLDENGHTKAAGEYVQVATRLGGGGPTEQAKALTNLDDADRIAAELNAELKRRGLSDEDIYDRLSAHGDLTEERAGLAEDYNAGRINSEVVRDELGAEAKPIAGEDDVAQGALFSPERSRPMRVTSYRGVSDERQLTQDVAHGATFSARNPEDAYDYSLRYGGKNPRVAQLAHEFEHPLIVHSRAEAWAEVGQPDHPTNTGDVILFDRLKEKGYDGLIIRSEGEGGTYVDLTKQGPRVMRTWTAEELEREARAGNPPSHGTEEFFDRAGTAPPEEQTSIYDDVIDHGAQQAASPSPKGSGIAFTLRQMSERLARALHHPIREGYFPFARFGARGVYKPRPEVSRVIDLQDLDVAAHEAGHHIGKTYLGGLDDKETLKLLQNHPGVESDLRRLGVDLYGPKKVDLHLQEGIAELFKWSVIDPAHLQQRAPNALRWLHHEIFPREPEIARAFQHARADFELYQKSPAQQKVSALYAQHSIARPIADIYDAVKRFLRQKLTDDLGEFQQLEREGAIPRRAQDDPYLLAMATRTDGAWVTNALNYGIPNATGRRMTVSYKSLLDRVPKGKATEWKNYLIAERLMEQASHELKIPDGQGGMKRLNDVLTEAPQLLTGPRGIMARALLDKKIQSLTGGLQTNAQGGTGKTVRAGLTFDEVKDLVEAGRKDAKLSAWAEDYWQFNHATLRLLSGHLLTPAEVSTILDANEKYVDFHRMFDGEPQGVNASGTGKGFGSNTKGVSRLRGSSRSIGDPLESPVLALYRAARLVHKHQAFEAMAKLAGEKEGLGDVIEEVHAPSDAIRLTITDEVAKQLKGMGLDPDDVDNLVGAQLVQYVARQFATGRDTRNMVLPRLVKGKRRWYKVGDKRLWDAVQAMGSEEVPEWVRWLEIPARTLRAGTTLVPGFSVGTNWFRDAFDAATYSKGGTRPPFYHFIRGLFHMAKQDAIFHLFEQEGGDVSSQMLYDRQQLPSRLRDLSKNKALAEKTVVVQSAADWARAASELSRRYLVESWLRPLEHLASIPERATRIGETALVHDKLLKEAQAKAKASGQALTDQDRIDIRKRAAEAGREVTLNFARGGTWVRQWNRLAVFLKPSVESMARFGRETGKSGPKRSFTVLARMAAWIGIPAVAAYLAQRKDKDFQSTPSWMKNTGLVFIEHNDDGSFKRRWYFPIPNLEGWLWSVVPTRILEWMDTKNPGALDDIGTAFNETVRPSLTPTAAVPMIENDRNRSFFGNRPIEPSGLEQLEPGYRATPETGEAARLLGKKAGISPAKIENTVRGYTGGLGDVALKGADKAVHAVAGALGKPQEVNSIRDVDPLHTAPVVGRFARGQGSAMSSEWVQQFYDTWTKNNEYRATLIDLRKQGRDEEADAYLDQHMSDIATVASASELHPNVPGAKPGPLREAHDALTQLRQRMDMLSRDQLTPQEYRAQVAEVNEQMLMVARRALEAAGIRVMPAGSPEP